VADTLLRPGHNCWRAERAGRVAFLVDGAAYFDALAAAIERAERQVWLVGWDFHSRVRLWRTAEDPAAERDQELVARLEARIAERPELRVYILEWDFAMIYALEREPLPLLQLGLRTHRNVLFHLDDGHPVGGSHHQKLAVVDDAVAFAGGIDVTACRFDTPAHRADEPLRSDTGFKGYGPFHDVQAAVDGAAAAALGDLCRERWRRATGGAVDAPEVGDAWPPDLAPDAGDVSVGIARTEPAYRGRPEVREVEQLHLDGIAAARRWIYLENQYFTASRVGHALAERLREPDGPEVVVVLPEDSGGWLEETTMGVLRARLLDALCEADLHGRLRVLHPVLPDLAGRHFTVHSKVAVVDERHVRVGSANLADRSMGLDTECDLALDGAGDARVAAASRALLVRLLAEHLGAGEDEVARRLDAEGSLVRTVDGLAGGARTLARLDWRVPDWMEDVIPAGAVLDPRRPVDYETLRQELGPRIEDESDRSRLAGVGITLVALLLLGAAWRWTPLGDWMTPEKLAALARPFSAAGTGHVLGIAAITAGGALMVPVTVMIVASALVFGWLEGFGVAFTGSALSALLGYWVGRWLWRDTVRRIAGRRLQAVGRFLERRGLWAVATARLVPVAPFTIVNLAMGASRVRGRDFLLGTLLGMAPGALVLCLVADRAAGAIVDPEAGSIAVTLALVVAFVAGTLWLRRRLGADAGS